MNEKSTFSAKKLKVINIFFNFLDIDKAVFFNLASKIWVLSAGPITALMIAAKFSPEVQGYYFTFATLLTLQAFAELGLGAVLVQFSAHEWSHLYIDDKGFIRGSRLALARLSSLAKIAWRWYGIGAFIVLFGLGLGGVIFFSSTENVEQVQWFWPWLSLSLVTAITLLLVPLWAILEGCNQVEMVYKFRFIQAAGNSVVMWIAILLGANLWTGIIAGVVSIFTVIFLMNRHYKKFIVILLKSKSYRGVTISWIHDLLPMQWRMALATISAFFMYSFFVPISFKYQGPILAGQIGLTLTIIMAMGNLSFAWFTPKIPQFAMLVAKSQYRNLDLLFYEKTKKTFIVLIAGSIVFIAALYLLNIADIGISKKMLHVKVASIFVVAYAIGYVSAPFSHYLRAHKKEPIFLVGIIGSVLIGFSTYVSGKYFDVNVMAFSYLIINILMTSTIIYMWKYLRRKWHHK